MPPKMPVSPIDGRGRTSICRMVGLTASSRRGTPTNHPTRSAPIDLRRTASARPEGRSRQMPLVPHRLRLDQLAPEVAAWQPTSNTTWFLLRAYEALERRPPLLRHDND